ncbi:PEP-CTERM sorting domain-containing protein [Nocardia sp. NPDC050630]|uniref:PEP-CTERM sorting domain-containing protein n=1 Tax=Nocardia sp. NPDC050630 TaxID=3364321 RepID=UPI0037987A1D
MKHRPPAIAQVNTPSTLIGLVAATEGMTGLCSTRRRRRDLHATATQTRVW